MLRPFTALQGSRAVPVLLSALLTASCVCMPRGITIPGAGHYPWLPSAAFNDTVSVTQSVTISGSNPQQFLLQTEVTPAGLSMVGLTGFGQKLFELQYERDTLTVRKTPFLPGSLNPASLFADFQLSYWPGELLRKLFAGTDAEFLEADGRRLFRNTDGVAIEILYGSAAGIESDLVYRDLRRDYVMQIKVIR